MARKDEDIRENIDRSKQNESEPHIPESKKKYADEAKGVGEVNVKNAHASGDGSTGRNDTRLDEDDSSGDPEID